MSLDIALSKAKTQVPNCIAIGYVDMDQGVLLASIFEGNHPDEIKALLGAATAEQMQGPNVQATERLFAELRGAKHVQRMIKRMTFETENGLFHIAARCVKHADHAVMFVCSKGVNQGMASAKAAIVLPLIEAAF